MKEYGERGLHSGLSTLGDFKKFLLRGNVVDLAVGIVIGAAFTSLVQEFVKDLITPLIGLFGGFKFQDFSPHNFAIGAFLNALISFLIVSFVVYFFVVRPMNALQDRYNRLMPKKEVAPTTRECPFCLSTIPLKATRCAYCTAQIPLAEPPHSASAASQA